MIRPPRPTRSPAVEAARRASECGWFLRGCHQPAVADVWARGPQGVDQRQVCATHLTVATAIGYQQGEPPGSEAVGG